MGEEEEEEEEEEEGGREEVERRWAITRQWAVSGFRQIHSGFFENRFSVVKPKAKWP
jgi:hypothetical protein